MYCGFDFGTSNSTVGIISSGKVKMINLEKEKPELRSAIFISDEERELYFGRTAIDRYLSHEEGRLMTSLKSVLGSQTMNEKTKVFNELKSYKDILGQFIKHIKAKTEEICQKEVDSALLGRPVFFNDKDKRKDEEAERTLREIVQSTGIKNIHFQYEPVAAAHDYINSYPSQKEKYAVVVDIGGGTSDFTILKFDNRSTNILATSGIHIGGTDLDRLISLNKAMPLLGMNSHFKSSSGQLLPLPNTFFHDLSTWHTINNLYSKQEINRITMQFSSALEKNKTNRFLTVVKNKEGHRILENCENAKIKSTNGSIGNINLDFIEKGLHEELSEFDLGLIIEGKISEIIEKINFMNDDSGVSPDLINNIFFTGGTSQISNIRNLISSIYRNAEIVKGDAFSSVGRGLTIEARRIFS